MVNNRNYGGSIKHVGCAVTSIVVGAGVRSLREASLVDSTIFPPENVPEKSDNAESNATA